MGSRSSIEWTESTWNPVTGCTKISPGCKHCYAERMALRLRAMGQPNYVNGFKLTVHKHMLELPLIWKRPRMIFVNSMSDLFHENVPLEFVQEVFDIMRRASWHIFQVLTKRSGRLLELDQEIDWPPNVWMGVSVENQDYVFRVDHLRQTNACLKFLSLEPLLGPLPNLDLRGIDWVIVGGESGPGARPIKEEWVIGIRDQCLAANVPFFFKQWGGVRKKRIGRVLQERTWDEMPRQTGKRRVVSEDAFSRDLKRAGGHYPDRARVPRPPPAPDAAARVAELAREIDERVVAADDIRGGGGLR